MPEIDCTKLNKDCEYKIFKNENPQFVFHAGGEENPWLIKINNDGIFFNKERYPNSTPDDFAKAFIEILERNYQVEFKKKSPPYDRE